MRDKSFSWKALLTVQEVKEEAHAECSIMTLNDADEEMLLTLPLLDASHLKSLFRL